MTAILSRRRWVKQINTPRHVLHPKTFETWYRTCIYICVTIYIYIYIIKINADRNQIMRISWDSREFSIVLIVLMEHLASNKYFATCLPQASPQWPYATSGIYTGWQMTIVISNVRWILLCYITFKYCIWIYNIYAKLLSWYKASVSLISTNKKEKKGSLNQDANRDNTKYIILTHSVH